MIPVLNAEQIRAADKYTIENEPIPSLRLMERAARAFVNKFSKMTAHGQEVHIFCGIGNNGGDGLAIGRILMGMGHRVHFYIIGDLEKCSEDFKSNYERLNSQIIQHITDANQVRLDTGDVVIDGIFGTGLTRPVTGLHAEVIDSINESRAEIYSIDLPSGLFSDTATPKEGSIIHATGTISFQVPKLVFFLPECAMYIGKWFVVDIGLNQSFIDGLSTHIHQVNDSDVCLPVRKHFSHKGDAGRLLLVSGSKGKMGAAVLAASSAMRSGCGLLYVHTPGCGLDILQTKVPEAMVEMDEHTEVVSEISMKEGLSAVAVGPGIGTGVLTQKAIEELIKKVVVPLVLDADAINILALNTSLLGMLPRESILTPHPGEFHRLVGKWKDDFEKMELLRRFCKQYHLNVVLKGAYSAVCDSSGNICFNITGNPGLSTAGSGDVLTGIVGALLGQGLAPINALISGVYLHGLSADMAVAHTGQISLIASDVVKFLPKAFLQLEMSNELNKPKDVKKGR